MHAVQSLRRWLVIIPTALGLAGLLAAIGLVAAAVPTVAAEKAADLAAYCRTKHGRSAFPSVDRRDDGLMCSRRTSGGLGLLHRKIRAADVCAAQHRTRRFRRQGKGLLCITGRGAATAKTIDLTKHCRAKYGPTAFPLDYPNVRDRSLRRGGDGIWIHGVAPQAGNRPPRDTDGCIALRNDELLAIADKLLPLVTPVVITRKIDWRRPQQIAALREELNAALDAWAKSYESGDLHRYLSSYADNFEYRGMIRSEWAAFRTATFTNVVRSLALDDVLLLADPEESELREA